MSNRPRVILYDTSNGNQVSSGYVDPISPTESEGEEVYNPITGKFERAGVSRYSKSGLGNNPLNQFAFQTTPPQPEVIYPDRVRRCGFLRESTMQIMLGALVGLCAGILLSHFNVSDDFSDLVNLPGKVFLQVLKCFVVPMVFTSLSTTVADIVLLGKVSIVGTRTALIFTGLSFLGSALSLAISMLLRDLVPYTKGVVAETSTAYFNVMCENGNFLTYNSTGTASCSATSMDSTTRLEFYDPKRILLTDDTASAATTVSMQVTDILNQLVPSNIFWSFEQGLILSVTTFAIAFGAAAIKTSSRENSPLLDVLKQMNKVFFCVISKAIDCSPIAVMSLVAGSLASQDMLGEAAKHVGVLVLATILSIVIFELVFFPILLWLTLRKNPFPYMRAMLPAAMFALGSSSSLVTLPVTIRCVESTREVPRSLLQFVVTIGCILHKNGSAIYFPCAIVFLASTTEEAAVHLGWLQLVLILLLSVLGSMGTAPIPNSSVVMIYSIWTTIYPSKEVPASYSYLVAISWFLGRLVTVCNILGDGYVARIIAEQIEDEDVDNIEMQ
ncbi:Dicarboxylate/amino acid:cation (Na or H) symporter protein [Phytophthora megakarya]|uniref:Amino acid transporter n=1 Tax=Phytophthora megakarya TaxID=4795 RepID=A0A225UU71_9STRA|nr:Dicarboxylate/amino acid:cation (Na or H) symporter protein [Phytophthora megakarya]